MLKKILTVPTEELGRWSRFAVLQIRIWRQCFRLLMQNRSRTMAAALSYHTVFGIVPLAIVMLMVFQMFPANRDIGDRVKTFAYEQLHLTSIEYPVEVEEGVASESVEGEQEKKSVTIAAKIDELTEGYIAKLNRGAITFVSALIVIWAAIGLLTTIERAFNSIWHVSRGRSFLHRMINYWALLTLAPLLLGAGFYISAHYLMFSELQEGVMGYMQPVLPFMISLIAFFFLYFVMPNTRVNPGSALWGAAVAAFLWMAAKYGFRMYVMNVIPYQAVYGILGIIPLAVFWIFITWLIVLFGLQLTYATQHVKTLDAAEIAMMRKNELYFLANDVSAFKVMSFVLSAFEKKKEQPVSVAEVCKGLDMPNELGDKMMEHLVKVGLLCQTNEPKVGFVPSTDGRNISLADISEAVAKASFAQEEEYSGKLKDILDEQRQRLGEYTLQDILGASDMARAELLNVQEEESETESDGQSNGLGGGSDQ